VRHTPVQFRVKTVHQDPSNHLSIAWILLPNQIGISIDVIDLKLLLQQQHGYVDVDKNADNVAQASYEWIAHHGRV